MARFRTVKEARDAGNLSGRTWTSSWRPGGPFVFTPFNGYNSPEYAATCRLSGRCRNAYLAGWDEGQKKKEDMP